MQKPQPRHLAIDACSDARRTLGEQPKAVWHRPTIRFVPLQVTAEDIGSGTDASSSTFINDALDDSQLK